MQDVFVVGGIYGCTDSGFEPIEVTRRTDKTIWVRNSGNKWKMAVRHDDDGSEYVRDSTYPPSWRDTFVYKPCWEYTGEDHDFFANEFARKWARRS